MNVGQTQQGDDRDGPNTDATLGFPNPDQVLARITEALRNPPVGLVLLEVRIAPDVAHGPVDEQLFLKSVGKRIAKKTEPGDTILPTGPQQLTIIRSGLTAPAEAEGLCLRVQAGLQAPMPVGRGRVTCHAAIGVAVSRSGDTAGLLAQYAEHALGDAKLLGGDTVVAFDDQDRDLIIQRSDPSTT